jgi:hypothetical protein
MKNWRFAILFILVLAGGVVANAWQYLGEAKVERNQLKNFPSQIGSWEQAGGDRRRNESTGNSHNHA